MGEEIVNIAGYRFVDLPDRDELRKPLQELCATLELKGTILLSTEGINFFLAASGPNVSKFISELEKDKRFAGITLKRSYTDYQPFNRMNVRLKKEIISVGMDEIQPARFTGETSRLYLVHPHRNDFLLESYIHTIKRLIISI